MTTNGNAVAVRSPQRGLEQVPQQALATIDEGRRALWGQLFFDGATDADIEFCLAFCAHRDLDPLRGEVVFTKFTKRKKVGNNWQDEGYTVTPVVTAVGYRVQASRSGDYLGQTPREWCGEDGVWKQVWLSDKPPAAARVGILRRGCPQPIYAVAVFKRFAKYSDPQYGPVKLAGLWATHPDVMIATRAETAAFKLAFPETRRQDSTPSRIVYRDLADGQRLRTIAGAIADDDGGEFFPHLSAGESLATLDQWSEANRELHALIAQRHPEEPDVHAVVHDLVCARFGVDSTKDATTEQLVELMDEIYNANADQEPEEDVIEAEGTVSDGDSEEAQPDANPKIGKWIENIDAVKTVRRFDAIVTQIAKGGLAGHRDIRSALAIKRGELGLEGEDPELGPADRAVARTVAP
jgi:hypothetical protein